MLNVIFPEVDWRQIQCIGFDLDGTIYDEFEFTKQVYSSIVHNLNTDVNKGKILYFMLNRWLEKGSSYPFIFKETNEKFSIDDNFEGYALNLFRNYNPELRLSSRIEYLLTIMKNEGKYLFLLTDGKAKLQNKKIDALKIRSCFDLIIIAEKNQKPDSFYGKEFIQKKKCKPYHVVYIGDRIIDKQFAENCGFVFLQIKTLLDGLRC